MRAPVDGADDAGAAGSQWRKPGQLAQQQLADVVFFTRIYRRSLSGRPVIGQRTRREAATFDMPPFHERNR
jgi:hypothetical protein